MKCERPRNGYSDPTPLVLRIDAYNKQPSDVPSAGFEDVVFTASPQMHTSTIQGQRPVLGSHARVGS